MCPSLTLKSAPAIQRQMLGRKPRRQAAETASNARTDSSTCRRHTVTGLSEAVWMLVCVRAPELATVFHFPSLASGRRACSGCCHLPS